MDIRGLCQSVGNEGVLVGNSLIENTILWHRSLRNILLDQNKLPLNW